MPFIFQPELLSTVFNPPASFLRAPQTTSSPIADEHGHLWAATDGLADGTYIRCFGMNNNILQGFNFGDLWAVMSAYANSVGGSMPSATAPSLGGGATIPGIGCVKAADGSSYVVISWGIYNTPSFSSFNHMVCVFTSAVDGALTPVGLAWTIGWGAPTQADHAGISIDIAGGKTADDPIIVWTQGRQPGGAEQGRCFATTFPSINAIAGKAHPCNSARLQPSPNSAPSDTYWNIGSTNVCANGFGGYYNPVFFLPGPGGTTNAFVYISKYMMATFNTASPYLTTLNATYPNGVLIKIPLGVLTSATFGGSAPTINGGSNPDGSTVTPAVANAFQPGAYTAFTDVGKNWDGTGSHGSDDYYPSPGVLAKLDDGTWQVGWYRPQFVDDSYNPAGGWSMYGTARVQVYNPTTEVFTDQYLGSGAIVPTADIGAPDANGGIDIECFAIFWQGNDLLVWNVNGDNVNSVAPLYTWLAKIGVFVSARRPTSVAMRYVTLVE